MIELANHATLMLGESSEASSWSGLSRAILIVALTIALPFLVWGAYRAVYLLARALGVGR